MNDFNRTEKPKIEDLLRSVREDRMYQPRAGGLASPAVPRPDYEVASEDYLRQQLGVGPEQTLYEAIMALGPERMSSLLAILRQPGGPFGSPIQSPPQDMDRLS